jgi:hypothetical protein
VLPRRPGVTFIDTNILVYSPDIHDKGKHRVAANLLAQLWTSGLGILSTQTRQVVHDYSEWCRVDIDPLRIISAGRLDHRGGTARRRHRTGHRRFAQRSPVRRVAVRNPFPAQ